MGGGLARAGEGRERGVHALEVDDGVFGDLEGEETLARRGDVRRCFCGVALEELVRLVGVVGHGRAALPVTSTALHFDGLKSSFLTGLSGPSASLRRWAGCVFRDDEAPVDSGLRGWAGYRPSCSRIRRFAGLKATVGEWGRFVVLGRLNGLAALDRGILKLDVVVGGRKCSRGSSTRGPRRIFCFVLVWWTPVGWRKRVAGLTGRGRRQGATRGVATDASLMNARQTKNKQRDSSQSVTPTN